jgi:hypothetical protein
MSKGVFASHAEVSISGFRIAPTCPKKASGPSDAVVVPLVSKLKPIPGIVRRAALCGTALAYTPFIGIAIT